jgi:hypothetical protein
MAKFFLVTDSYRDAIVRILQQYAKERALTPIHFPYPALVEQAPTITLPELHVFRETDGAEFAVCGWDKEDAWQRTSQELWRKQLMS